MRLYIFLAVFAAAWTTPVFGQVGHSPANSPYTDLRTNHALNVNFSLMGGGGGVASVGPRNGRLIGVRYDIRTGTPTEFFFGLSRGDFDRTVIDPANGPDNRIVEQTQKRMTVAELGLNWLLTGKKSWHHLAPYFGMSTGLWFGGTIPTDPGAFGFTGKFFIGPQVGVRLYSTGRFVLRAEVRDVIWKLTYPPLYGLTPANDPSADAVIDLRVRGDTQWTHQPTLTLGMSFAFRY